MEQPITVGCLEGSDWLLHRFIEVNFSKLTDSNQIFRNDYVIVIIIIIREKNIIFSVGKSLPT